jgi:hypothetical protein
MNCRNARKMMGRHALERHAALEPELQLHLSQCAGCRRRWRLDRLVAGLLASYRRPEEEFSPSPYFFARLWARINEKRAASAKEMDHFSPQEMDHFSPLGFGETIVAAARGWLLGFGAVAALLFAISLAQLPAPPGAAGPNAELNPEALGLPPRSENILIANGESLSPDAVLQTLVVEDSNHDRQ